jgi:hypothetical protein
MVTDTTPATMPETSAPKARIALIAHFDGDPRELAERFGVATSRYAQDPDAPQPESAFLMRNKEGIAVVLVWPEGSGIRPFQSFLRGALDELGLPHPRVEHFRAEPIRWDAATT